MRECPRFLRRQGGLDSGRPHGTGEDFPGTQAPLSSQLRDTAGQRLWAPTEQGHGAGHLGALLDVGPVGQPGVALFPGAAVELGGGGVQ